MSEIVQVDVTLLGRQFTIGTPLEERDTLEQAVRLLADKIQAIAEAEGGWISLRTQEAMARPSVRKKLKGRQPAIPPETDAAIAKALDEGDRSAADVARVFRISRSGVYRAVARHRARVGE